MAEFPQRPYRPFLPLPNLLAGLPNHTEPILVARGGAFWDGPAEFVFGRERFDYHRGALLAGPGIGFRLALEEEAHA